jgi:hypothetical protein
MDQSGRQTTALPTSYNFAGLSSPPFANATCTPAYEVEPAFLCVYPAVVYIQISVFWMEGLLVCIRITATSHSSALYFSPPFYFYGLSSFIVAPVISRRHGGEPFVSSRVGLFPSSAFASSRSLSFRQRPGYPASITFHIQNRLSMLFL